LDPRSTKYLHVPQKKKKKESLEPQWINDVLVKCPFKGVVDVCAFVYFCFIACLAHGLKLLE